MRPFAAEVCRANSRPIGATPPHRRAQAAAGLRPLRWHDLRHNLGSLLAAAGVDLVTIQAVMGHSALATTGRYLHARPAVDQAEVFTRAFELRPRATASSQDAVRRPQRA
jgi:integrase